MATKATEIKGEIRTRRTYDVRKDPKTGQKSEVSPVTCACCHREIYIVSELVNGDIIGSECQGVISIPVYRVGRTLNSKQVAYAKSRGLLGAA